MGKFFVATASEGEDTDSFAERVAQQIAEAFGGGGETTPEQPVEAVAPEELAPVEDTETGPPA